MYYISNEIGKKIFSLYDMKQVGVITNILFSNKTKKATYMIVVNEEEDFHRFVIPMKHIYQLGHDVVTIKNTSCMQPYENLDLEISGYYNPIFDTIIDGYGNNYGYIKDVLLSKGYKIVNFINDKNEILPLDNIVCFTHQTILYKEKETTLHRSQFRPRKHIDFEYVPEQKVTIQEVTQPATQTISNHTTILPNKTIANYNFLINRIVKKNILASNGDVLIKENSRISSIVIDKARMFGKLKELMEFSTPSLP